MDGFTKVDVVVSVNGKQIATQITHIKNFNGQAITQEVACSLLKLSVINGITGMVIQDSTHVTEALKGA